MNIKNSRRTKSANNDKSKKPINKQKADRNRGPNWNRKEGGQGKNDLPEGLCRTSKKNRKS
jgi:hypothetical protein